MPASPEDLFAFLDQLTIAHQTVEHPAFFTVEDGRDWHDKIPGLHCKNLFLKDKKGRLWLVVMPADKRADLAAIAQRTGAVKFSFANAQMLMDILGVPPGSVTPFAVMNDTARVVSVVLDADMMQADLVNYHPFHNTASTIIKASDLLTFMRALGYDPLIAETGAP